MDGHHDTNATLGKLVNASMRKWKKAEHAAFDLLWKAGRFKGKRNAAYLWLAQQLGLPVSETHIGMFDVEECISTILICSKETKGDY